MEVGGRGGVGEGVRGWVRGSDRVGGRVGVGWWVSGRGGRGSDRMSERGRERGWVGGRVRDCIRWLHERGHA